MEREQDQELVEMSEREQDLVELINDSDRKEYEAGEALLRSLEAEVGIVQRRVPKVGTSLSQIKGSSHNASSILSLKKAGYMLSELKEVQRILKEGVEAMETDLHGLQATQ